MPDRILEYLGRGASAFPGEWLGKCRGPVVVCGTGWTLWEDLEKCGFVASKWSQGFEIIAVNRAVMDMPSRVAHCYSNHMDMMLHWVHGRDVSYTQKDRHLGGGPVLHSNREYTRTVRWDVPGSGTSTLNAVIVALLLGYDDVKVCGAPMDNGPHYYDAPWFAWNRFAGEGYAGDWQNNGLLRPWGKLLQRLGDIVEPMSGNPRAIWESLRR